MEYMGSGRVTEGGGSLIQFHDGVGLCGDAAVGGVTLLFTHVL